MILGVYKINWIILKINEKKTWYYKFNIYNIGKMKNKNNIIKNSRAAGQMAAASKPINKHLVS